MSTFDRLREHLADRQPPRPADVLLALANAKPEAALQIVCDALQTAYEFGLRDGLDAPPEPPVKSLTWLDYAVAD